MNRRHFLLAAGLFTLLPTRAVMADSVDDVVDLLKGQGFDDIVVTRTLLGRTRIVATNTSGSRELILNARTGEVLRDVWFNASGQSGPGIANSASGSGSDDDAADDDNSGHGGGDDDNSGHGNGGDDDSGDDDSGSDSSDDGDDD